MQQPWRRDRSSLGYFRCSAAQSLLVTCVCRRHVLDRLPNAQRAQVAVLTLGRKRHPGAGVPHDDEKTGCLLMKTNECD